MAQNKGFRLDTRAGYFRNLGVDVMAFDDIYPAGHQSGVSILMHGHRVATNGDLRFEQTPGQWQPLPKQGERTLSEAENTISTRLHYPDMQNHLNGFNPMIYPDCELDYSVTVRGEGEKVVVTVDLDAPIPEKFAGKICFNMELFPGALFGKPWILDDKQGIFPRQPNAPTKKLKANRDIAGGLQPLQGAKADRAHLEGEGEYSPIVADDLVALPYASGRKFICRPDDPYSRFAVVSKTSDIALYDGRMNHNNGWFVLSSEVPVGATRGAIVWEITPNVVETWMYAPVVQVSQVGYHPAQRKVAIVELDGRDESAGKAALLRVGEAGETVVREMEGEKWGRFLRYNYLRFDFSDVKEPGLYKVRYGASESAIFRLGEDVYDRGVWQPVLEYFLPVQMCHMRVNEKYRVWHGHCHSDDARMAPTDFNHIDGYAQGSSTLCKYKPGDAVPGLGCGGWHDAGDFDLRIESQAGESYILTLAYEAFHVQWDETTIDQGKHVVEIHQPDGKNDILQQIEHGLLSVVGAYKALGRLYRGIIANGLRQYVLLGDPTAMTDGVPGNADDRWVFTEDNPARELTSAAELAACARAMRGFNEGLAADSLAAARELYDVTRVETDAARLAKVQAAVELFLTTKEEKYRAYLLDSAAFIAANAGKVGWIACRAVKEVDDAGFTAALREAMVGLKREMDALSAETPYGIPYRPHIWGAGWDIQRLGFQYYFLHKAFPEIFGKELMLDALNFVLGCHPGSNTSSFASGVGAKSTTTAYGINRADWSYTPGGVVSGTALIRPDFPELLEFPFLWQQMEYVLGGGSSNYMFLVLAAKEVLK